MICLLIGAASEGMCHTDTSTICVFCCAEDRRTLTIRFQEGLTSQALQANEPDQQGFARKVDCRLEPDRSRSPVGWQGGARWALAYGRGKRPCTCAQQAVSAMLADQYVNAERPQKHRNDSRNESTIGVGSLWRGGCAFDLHRCWRHGGMGSLDCSGLRSGLVPPLCDASRPGFCRQNLFVIADAARCTACMMAGSPPGDLFLCYCLRKASCCFEARLETGSQDHLMEQRCATGSRASDLNYSL